MIRAIVSLTAALMIATATAAASAQSTATATAPSTAPAASASPQAIQQWIDDLASDLAAKRDSAQGALISAGQDSIPALQKLLESTSNPEARDQAKLALKQIEENQRIGVTLVTLHLKDTPAKEAFEALKKQTGMDIAPSHDQFWDPRFNRNSGAVTIDVDRQPYWTVVRELCAQTGLSVDSFGREMHLNNGDRGRMKAPMCLQGPFMFLATGSQYYRQTNYGADQNRNEQLSIQIMVYPEPKIQLMGYTWNPQITEAVDEKGNSLLISNRGVGPDNWMEHETAHTYSIALQPLKDRGQKLAKFKGSIRVRVASQTEKLEIPDVLNGQSTEKTLGGYRIVVKDGKRNGQQGQVVVEMYRQQGWMTRLSRMGAGSDATWPRPDSIRFIGPNGQVFRNNGWGGGGGDSERKYSTSFSIGLLEADEALKLVWEIPTEFKELDLPFDFTDLPLP